MVNGNFLGIMGAIVSEAQLKTILDYIEIGKNEGEH
jgi:hypothetical protein